MDQNPTEGIERSIIKYRSMHDLCHAARIVKEEKLPSQTRGPHKAQDATLPGCSFRVEDAAQRTFSLNKKGTLTRTSRKGRAVRAPFY